MTAHTLAGHPDRRRLRAERTRQSIIDAYLALLRESPRNPTSIEIAANARCSVRLVFERFPDLHSLRVAAAEYVVMLAMRHAEIRNQDTDRAARIQSDVLARSQMSDILLPVWRILNATHDEGPETGARLDAVREALWSRSEIVYEAELSTLDKVERRALLIAIEAITDVEAWGRMRDFGLTEGRIREVWATAMDRLLPATPLHHAEDPGGQTSAVARERPAGCGEHDGP